MEKILITTMFTLLLVIFLESSCSSGVKKGEMPLS